MGLTHSPIGPSDGLVLCLDTANRRSYPGSGTNWFDLSGNGNHGVLTNGPTLNTGPRGGMNFDGVNDYVETGKQLIASFPFTITAWLKSNGSQNLYACPLSQGHFDYKGFAFQIGFPSANDMQFICGNGNPLGPWVAVAFNFAARTDTAWTHLVATVTSSNVTTYKNGIQQATVNVNSVLDAVNFTIGRDAINTDSNNRTWQGQLDDIRVYNRILSSAEIRQLFEIKRRRYL